MLTVTMLILLLAGAACSPEEDSGQQKEQQGQAEQESPQPTQREEGTMVERTAEPTAALEEERLGVGEEAESDGLTLRLFEVRQEERAYFTAGPGEPSDSTESSAGEYLAVDYLLENAAGPNRTLDAEVSLEDEGGDSYRPDPDVASPGAGFEGVELAPEEKGAYTAFFEVPPNTVPEALSLEWGGESVLYDPGLDAREEIPAEDYLQVYHHYFNQRDHEEAYGMLLDPETEHGVSLGDWLSFYEPLWGERYIELEDVSPLSASEEEAIFMMERSFYTGDGTLIPDEEINANTEQRLVREDEEWKIVMRDDLAEDILGSAESTPESGSLEEPAQEAPEETQEGSPSAPQGPQDEEDPEGQDPGVPGTTVTVTRVVDGDTIEVSPGVDGIEDVRLIGVDTPETYGGAEPMGSEASAFTQSALEGREVSLEFDVERVDPYGRALAYVWLPDGSLFNETLVREGYAQVATFPPNVKYQERFLAAQEEARVSGSGLWGLSQQELCELADRGNGIGEGSPGCETGQAPETGPVPEPSPGGSGSGVAAPVTESECPASHPIKGNADSGIYHPPEGQYYDVTNPEECFASPEAAAEAGYRASER
jgi:micrococcal nuclease